MMYTHSCINTDFKAVMNVFALFPVEHLLLTLIRSMQQKPSIESARLMKIIAGK